MVTYTNIFLKILFITNMAFTGFMKISFIIISHL